MTKDTGILILIVLITLPVATVEDENLKFACYSFCDVFSDAKKLFTFSHNPQRSIILPEEFKLNDTKVLALVLSGFPFKRGFIIKSRPSGIFGTDSGRWKCVPKVTSDTRWLDSRFDDNGWPYAEAIRSNSECDIGQLNDSSPDELLQRVRTPCLATVDANSKWISHNQHIPFFKTVTSIQCRIDASHKESTDTSTATEAQETKFGDWLELLTFMAAEASFVVFFLALLYVIFLATMELQYQPK